MHLGQHGACPAAGAIHVHRLSIEAVWQILAEALAELRLVVIRASIAGLDGSLGSLAMSFSSSLRISHSQASFAFASSGLTICVMSLSVMGLGGAQNNRSLFVIPAHCMESQGDP